MTQRPYLGAGIVALLLVVVVIGGMGAFDVGGGPDEPGSSVDDGPATSPDDGAGDDGSGSNDGDSGTTDDGGDDTGPDGGTDPGVGDGTDDQSDDEDDGTPTFVGIGGGGNSGDDEPSPPSVTSLFADLASERSARSLQADARVALRTHGRLDGGQRSDVLASLNRSLDSLFGPNRTEDAELLRNNTDVVRTAGSQAPNVTAHVVASSERVAAVAIEDAAVAIERFANETGSDSSGSESGTGSTENATDAGSGSNGSDARPTENDTNSHPGENRTGSEPVANETTPGEGENGTVSEPAENETAEARRHLERARNASTNADQLRSEGNYSGAVAAYNRSWQHAQAALDVVDGARSPRVTIHRAGSFREGDGDPWWTYNVNGTIRDVRPYTIETFEIADGKFSNEPPNPLAGVTTNPVRFTRSVPAKNETANVTVRVVDGGPISKLTDRQQSGDEVTVAYVHLDGDNLSDRVERNLTGLDTLDPDSDHDGVLDGREDSDGDGLTNLAEVANGTAPGRADPDGDGLEDPAELDNGTDPFDPDTDGDGLRDGVEVELGTDPTDEYSDDDTTVDGNETYELTIANESLNVSLEVRGDGAAVTTASIGPGSDGNESRGVRDASVGPVVDVRAERAFENATITFAYDDSDVPEGAEESNLSVYRYDGSNRTSAPIDSTVDAEANEVSARIENAATVVPMAPSVWESPPGDGSEFSTDQRFDVESFETLENWTRTDDHEGTVSVRSSALRVNGQPDSLSENATENGSLASVEGTYRLPLQAGNVTLFTRAGAAENDSLARLVVETESAGEVENWTLSQFSDAERRVVDLDGADRQVGNVTVTVAANGTKAHVDRIALLRDSDRDGVPDPVEDYRYGRTRSGV